MTVSPTPRQRVRILAEAVGVGALCALTVIAWEFVFRKDFGWEDYEFLLPTFFGAGAIIYASGEAIARGRMMGSFVGAVLALLLFGWLVQFIVEGSHVIARLIAPGIGFFTGSVLGAVVERILRGRSGPVDPSADRTAEERNG